MTSAELVATLDGNTVEWGDGSRVHDDGDTIRSRNADGSPPAGRIDFADGRHCRGWDGGQKCSTVYDDGDLDSSGGRVTVIEGTPDGL